jgi:hypothetical protein
MDDRLQKALDHAHYKTTIAQQRENIKTRFQTALLYAHNGGIFTANSSLIGFVDALIQRGESEAILIDDKEKPVAVSDLSSFREQLFSIYFEATNEYFSEFERLRKARSVKAAVGV